MKYREQINITNNYDYNINNNLNNNINNNSSSSLSSYYNTPQLSQSDLLSALKAMSAVRYSDVRIGIISGLMNLLQGRGQILRGGWPVIIELISSVPASMSSEEFLSSFYEDNNSNNSSSNNNNSVNNINVVNISKTVSTTTTATTNKNSNTTNKDTDNIEQNNNYTTQQQQQQPEEQLQQSSSSFLTTFSNMTSTSIPQYEWPRDALSTSFDCMKLTVDEFLDVIMVENELIKSLIEGLALFSAQVKDVNISLTSLEMLWKVTDLAISKSSTSIQNNSNNFNNNNNFNNDLSNNNNTIINDDINNNNNNNNKNSNINGSISKKDEARNIISIFGITLKRLFLLSMDARPEVYIIQYYC